MDGLSEICPSCGNVIQSWANGVCYVCVRIEKEYKRYGRRRSQHRSPPASKKKVVRRKADPKSASRAPQSEKREAQREKRTTKSRIPSSYEKEHALEFRDRRLVRKGINRFLMAIYGERRYLSQILEHNGFTRNQIGRLRRERIDRFLRGLVAAWHWWLKQLLSPQAVTLLIRIYTLDGNGSKPLAPVPVGDADADVSAEQALHNAMSLLRRPLQSATLEELVTEVALHTLQDEDSA